MIHNLVVCASDGGGNFRHLIKSASNSNYVIHKLIVSSVYPRFKP